MWGQVLLEKTKCFYPPSPADAASLSLSLSFKSSLLLSSPLSSILRSPHGAHDPSTRKKAETWKTRRLTEKEPTEKKGFLYVELKVGFRLNAGDLVSCFN